MGNSLIENEIRYRSTDCYRHRWPGRPEIHLHLRGHQRTRAEMQGRQKQRMEIRRRHQHLGLPPPAIQLSMRASAKELTSLLQGHGKLYKSLDMLGQRQRNRTQASSETLSTTFARFVSSPMP